MNPSVSKRIAVAVLAATSVSLLAACETVAPGGGAGASAANPENTTILARGWELPKDPSVPAGARSRRGAHRPTAIAPPDSGVIETADIPAPGQGSALSGNPSGGSAGRLLETAEIIVRSRKR